MFDIFLVTYWIEFNNKLYQKVLNQLEVALILLNKYLQKLKNPYKLKAVVCDEPKNIFEKRKDKDYGHAYKNTIT